MEKYLSCVISKDQAKWRKHWKDHGTKHKKMPQEAYDLWLPHWSSRAGRQESETMSDLRAMQKPKHSNVHAANLPPGRGLSQIDTQLVHPT